MKNRKKVINSLERLDSIFELLYFNSMRDPNFPDEIDLATIAASKIELSKVELLLDSENDKIGKNDADNIGKPV